MAEKADLRWHLLISLHLVIGQACGVIHGDVKLVVADAGGADPLQVSGIAVLHPREPRQRLDVVMDEIAWPVPVVALH